MNPQEIHNIIQSHTIADGQHIIVDIDKSHESFVFDKLTNREYLDCSSHFASQALGYNHKSLVEQRDRLAKVCLHKYANHDYYSEELAEFVKSISGICPDFKHFFFIDGGCLAVDNAIKCAMDWKTHKRKQQYKWDVVGLKSAFHGRSGYPLSLTNTNPEKTRGFSKLNWRRLDIGSTSKAFFRTAAIIVEPIQGEGGDIHIDKDYLLELRKFCDNRDCLLIFDEIQTGFMTGKTWCYEHFGIVPDLMCFGKKTQVAGFCATSRIDDTKNVFNTPDRISSTFGGNIVDMVRFTIINKIIQDEKLVDNAAEVGSYLLDKMKNLSLDNARGRGLMVAFDVKNSKKRNILVDILLEEGLLCLPCGEKSIRLRPHLTFSKGDVDYAIDCIERGIKKL